MTEPDPDLVQDLMATIEHLLAENADLKRRNAALVEELSAREVADYA